MDEQQLSAETLLSTNDYSIEVTLVGEHLDPDGIDDILAISPTRKGKKGEARNDAPSGPLHEGGFWSHEVNARDDVNECRDHQITCLIDAISPKREELRAAGVDRIWFYYTLASSIGLLNIRLRPETMAQLAALEADLYISCFDCFNPKHEFWKGEETVASGTESV